MFKKFSHDNNSNSNNNINNNNRCPASIDADAFYLISYHCLAEPLVDELGRRTAETLYRR